MVTASKASHQPAAESGRNYVISPFSFQGRIGRLQYFGWSLVFSILVWLAGTVLNLLFGGEPSVQTRTGAISGSAYIFSSVAFFVITASLGVRRLHDMNANGWWYLLAFIPGVSFIFGLVLLFAPGTPGANQYGVR